MLVGYRRSSTTDQIAGFDAQEAQLLATGCTKLFSEMVSSVADRSQLKAALDFVRSDDTLVNG
jgi:DNA invertase Pin-like site-specific DNA recombinase